MKISTQGVKFIKAFENLALKPYLCPAGHLTIGYGHLIRDDENFLCITEDQAEELFIKDLNKSENIIIRLTNVSLKQNQFDSLVSFVFNIGGAAYQRSTLRSKLNRREEVEVIAKEFLRWVYVRGQIMPGLVKRRHCESALFMR